LIHPFDVLDPVTSAAQQRDDIVNFPFPGRALLPQAVARLSHKKGV
jgi:hypothetical protein